MKFNKGDTIECIKNNSIHGQRYVHVTKGIKYKVLDYKAHNTAGTIYKVLITNDIKHKETWYMADCFKLVSHLRNLPDWF